MEAILVRVALGIALTLAGLIFGGVVIGMPHDYFRPGYAIRQMFSRPENPELEDVNSVVATGLRRVMLAIACAVIVAGVVVAATGLL